MPTKCSLTWIADCINWAHKATRTVTTVLENKVQQLSLPSRTRLNFFLTQEGKGVGSKFSDLAKIIAKVEDKTRVGIFLDTCKPISFVSHFDEMH